MTTRHMPEEATYDPNKVLDAIMERLNLKNDAALSRALEVAPPVISKIRHRTLPIGATILLRMHEVSEFSIRELKSLMGVQVAPMNIAA
jgi:hypothetical protein